MGRGSAPRRAFAMIYVLAGSAGALIVASSLALLETTALPIGGSAAPAAATRAAEAATRTGEAASSETFLSSEFQWIAGPLEVPTIGVVAPGFDEWYATVAIGAYPPGLIPAPPPPPVAHKSSDVPLSVSPTDPVREPSLPARGRPRGQRQTCTSSRRCRCGREAVS